MCVNENVCCALPHIFPTSPSVLAFLHFAFKQQKWQQQLGEVVLFSLSLSLIFKHRNKCWSTQLTVISKD